MKNKNIKHIFEIYGCYMLTSEVFRRRKQKIVGYEKQNGFRMLQMLGAIQIPAGCN